MANKILIDEYEVDLVKHRVYYRGEEVSIRPKSFELLKLLLQTPKEVVSKNTILSTIWDDVNVDEQVIFQSVKELRKAFSAIDAIKTFPRKGYAWVADSTSADETPVSVNSPSTNNSEIVSKSSSGLAEQGWLAKFKLPLIILVSFLFLLIIIFVVRGLDNERSNSERIDGSIIVLPIKEHLNDRDHKWVRVGGMDLLIQQIPPSDDYGVMQVDDVLEIMQRADISLNNIDPSQVDRIFQVSGAELIVTAELSGSPGDYQLVYSLRRKQSIDRGVLITSDIYDAIDQLADVVTQRLGTSASPLNISRNKLANQLLAQALDKKNTEDYEEAEQYLKSLLAIVPNNLQATRLLAEMSVYLKKTKQLNDIVLSVEEVLAERRENTGTVNELQDNVSIEYSQREYGRLKFWQGLNELQFHRTNKAKQILQEAEGIITSAQDWLYLGYVAEAQGHLSRVTKQYDAANHYYQTAIKNHRIIKCPFGETNNLLNLAENAYLQADVVEAKLQANKAFNLANKRELQVLIKEANTAKEKYALPFNSSDH